MSSRPASIVWFRQDLRLADNPALSAAVARGGPVIPVFIGSADDGRMELGGWEPGAASRWWLHQSLVALAEGLAGLGSELIVRRGASLPVLRALIGECGATAVFWNRRYEPVARDLDRAIAAALIADGVAVETFNAGLLYEPDEIRNQAGGPFQVFSAFWRACCKLDEPLPPTAAPHRLVPLARAPSSIALEALELEPSIDWAGGMREMWEPGEAGAAKQLRAFLDGGFFDYPVGRDLPDRPGSSRLSAHLHFGEVSARQIWHAVRARANRHEDPAAEKAAEVYLRELGWREFAHAMLVHFPETVSEPLRAPFARFPWKRDPAALRAWQRGLTGYPIVDAGMRELWATGWMHNRVRMVVGSFLVKDLLIDWRDGAAWFWDTLVDADLANNTLNWQWVAGCGADAAPYFRIFNPVLQGRKFDPDGDYVRRWVPELAALPARWIHSPWEAPSQVLRESEVMLGDTYPSPIVDHGEARKAALAALAETRS